MSNHQFDAVIFDLDGVITDTASVHSTAWKHVFDKFLRAHAQRTKTPFQEFTHDDDYLPFVDGKPRYKGVASFLKSRGIDLPYGSPADSPELSTVCGIGNRKNEFFNQIIQQEDITVHGSTVDFIHDLRAAGIKVGVATSSKNARTVLNAVGLSALIETIVDGVVSAELGLEGKPEPDIFTTACENLGVYGDRAVIVEDAISGVQAGQKGNFGLVIGVAREDNAAELRLHGADIVVEDLAEIGIEKVENWFTKGLREEGWSLSFYDYDPAKEGSRETLLTIGNGYFGTRGALEETSAGAINYPGTYFAGLYNRLESEVHGKTLVNEDLVNCPNWLSIKFKLGDGEWLDPNEAEIVKITRRLDFRTGELHREMLVRDGEGNETSVRSQRFASMDDPHLAALRYCIIPLNHEQPITFRSDLDGDIINAGVARYRQLSSKHLVPMGEGGEGGTSFLQVTTSQSAIQITEAARLLVHSNGRQATPEFWVESTHGRVSTVFTMAANKGVAITVDKIVSLHTSNGRGITDPLRASREALSGTCNYDKLQQASAAAWKKIWDKIDIQIQGDRTSQKLIRLNLYHSMVTASTHSAGLDVSIPARGLHGEAYRGHVFWDELYILPFYDIHFPETAKAALMYRYRRLPQARDYAHEHGYQGAMFPWQSGSDGREETQVLHLNPRSGEWGPDYSSLQRHVNLTIANNVWQYFWVTEDKAFLDQYGAELILDVCRFWAGMACFNKETGSYEIDGVMGPDEFHEKYPGATEGGLKDNSYTNIMVVWTFNQALDLLERMSDSSREILQGKMQLTPEELGCWRDIASNLNIPLSEEGILEQFDGYFDLEELDWGHYEHQYKDIHRMDRILKAECKSPDNYKVAKQADALMAFYVLGSEKVKSILQGLGFQVPADLLRRNFDYYLNRTSHGSTLSRLVHGYLAHAIGRNTLSWRFFSEALKSDHVDIQGGTTKEGIHVGVMTGTILFVLRAYAGLDLSGEQLKLDPGLPVSWRGMEFNIGFRGDQYSFILTPGSVEVKLEGERPKLVRLREHEILLKPHRWIRREL